MNVYFKRGLIVLLIIICYFTIWKSVRGFVTTKIVVPQIEYSIKSCDDTIAFDQLKTTSIVIHLLDRNANEYITYGYTSPAGFYFLFGLVFLVLLGGNKLYYYLHIGFHIVFWIYSAASIVPGLCYSAVFLHITFGGITYLTPLITSLILILLISPNLKRKLDVTDQLH